VFSFLIIRIGIPAAARQTKSVMKGIIYVPLVGRRNRLINDDYN